jgi:foldase protein PrsA
VAKKHSVIIIGLVAVIALVAAGAAGCGSYTLPPNVEAKVGKVLITDEQFNERLAALAAQSAGNVPDKTTDPNGYKDFERVSLNYMILVEIVRQQASALHITVSDQEVQARIDANIQNSFGGDKTKFEAGLKATNMTLDQLEVYYREAILVNKGYLAVTNSLPESAVSPAEIQSYYDSHKSLFYSNENREVRHIWIKAIPPTTSTTSTTVGTTATTEQKATDAQMAVALATAEKVRADLVGGADWNTEAAKYSDDAGSKDKGGMIGSVSKGSFASTAPEVDASIFSLQLNEISQPVKDGDSYHIIQVTSITPAKQYTLDESKSQIVYNLLAQKKTDYWLAWFAKMKKKIGVVVKPGMEDTITGSSTSSTTSGGSTTTTAIGTATTAATGATGPTTTSTAAALSTTAAP